MKNSKLYSAIFGHELEKTFTLEQAITILESMDLINIGEVAEQAISAKSGVERCSINTPDIDLVSGKQIKHARTADKNGRRIAYCSIKNHTTDILCVVTERLTNKEYFFKFPNYAYGSMYGNTIGIPFYENGVPYRNNRWWEYEVGSFEELCELAK